ncbi:MAG: hypothetical protein KJN66_03010, partial [Bacteroidia bacterium]|nr:hypothetical protein [Bacteroidia bacterium]
MRAIINNTKNVIEKTKWYSYHLEHKKEAKKILKNIESVKGKLSTKNKKLCKEYAKDVLGHKKYAPWLFVYSAYAQKFEEGWIPDNYYGEFVVPKINGEYGKLCNRNAIIGELLELSNPMDICYYINNLFLDTNFEVLSEEKIKKILFANRQKVVYKLEDSRQGKGIFFFDEKNFNLNKIKKLGNGVFQNFIEQHPFFMKFSKSAVANIRFTTICDDKG